MPSRQLQHGALDHRRRPERAAQVHYAGRIAHIAHDVAFVKRRGDVISAASCGRRAPPAIRFHHAGTRSGVRLRLNPFSHRVAHVPGASSSLFAVAGGAARGAWNPAIGSSRTRRIDRPGRIGIKAIARSYLTPTANGLPRSHHNPASTAPWAYRANWHPPRATAVPALDISRESIATQIGDDEPQEAVPAAPACSTGSGIAATVDVTSTRGHQARRLRILQRVSQPPDLRNSPQQRTPAAPQPPGSRSGYKPCAVKSKFVITRGFSNVPRVCKRPQQNLHAQRCLEQSVRTPAQH